MALQSDMITAIYQIADERGLPEDQVLDIIREAVLAAYEKTYGEGEGLSVEIDEETGEFSIYAEKVVVDEVEDPEKEISEKEATEMDDTLKSGDEVLVDITPEGFGRIAAQAARMKILQDIKEAERDAQILKLKERMGEIVTGVVRRPLRGGIIEVEVDRATAWMPKDEQIGREFYKSGERMRFLLKEIREIEGSKRAIVTRGDDNFLVKLFETEIPEINSGAVEIKEIARESGSRTKVAVYSLQEKIDPIGACVGPKGSRISAISEELGMKEKIDIIVWDEDPSIFIRNALAPATPIDVKVDEDEEQAIVLVDEGSLSLAIGKEGQNARLAAKLTGYKIDITGSEDEFKGMKGKTASEVVAEDEAAARGKSVKEEDGGEKEKEEKAGAKKESDKLVCPKCGKEYKMKHYFDKHVEKCEG